MRLKKSGWLILFLFCIAISIRLLSANPSRVENYYSTFLYPPVSAFLRSISGWLPVSLGDFLYGGLFIWLLLKTIKRIIALLKRQVTKQNLKKGLQKTLIILLSVYNVFNILWGINYNRAGIASQLRLSIHTYNAQELKTLTEILLQKVNESKMAVSKGQNKITNNKEIFNGSVHAYEELHKRFSFIQYNMVSVKSSLWGWLGNYAGFGGYYNPFTGEAQVNTTVPVFLQPYTTCHEMAHQLGYAKENEANFVGYLAATSSTDSFFHYSVYLDVFLYANRNLFAVDSSSAKLFSQQLLPAVKTDLKEWSDFDRRHKSLLGPVISWFYGKYLQSNQQPSGMLSYDEVTGFLIAYYKKYGKI